MGEERRTELSRLIVKLSAHEIDVVQHMGRLLIVQRGVPDAEGAAEIKAILKACRKGRYVHVPSLQ